MPNCHIWMVWGLTRVMQILCLLVQNSVDSLTDGVTALKKKGNSRVVNMFLCMVSSGSDQLKVLKCGSITRSTGFQVGYVKIMSYEFCSVILTETKHWLIWKSKVFYTFFVGVRETGGKRSKTFRVLFSAYIKENQS